MTRKILAIALATAVLGSTAAGSASALPARPDMAKPAATANTVIKISATSTWRKLFRPHPYTGQRFPYELLGEFTGDPDMRVQDHRRMIGEIYVCSYSRDLQGRYIICD